MGPLWFVWSPYSVKFTFERGQLQANKSISLQKETCGSFCSTKIRMYFLCLFLGFYTAIEMLISYGLSGWPCLALGNLATDSPVLLSLTCHHSTRVSIIPIQVFIESDHPPAALHKVPADAARCMSNALQQLHHSFNFYFFTGPNSHISNGCAAEDLVKWSTAGAYLTNGCNFEDVQNFPAVFRSGSEDFLGKTKQYSWVEPRRTELSSVDPCEKTCGSKSLSIQCFFMFFCCIC